MEQKNNQKIRNLVLAAMFLALCLLLPFLTGQIPQVGNALSPMHIPVLLCGFLCGWPFGLVVGAAAPLLRFSLFGLPPLFPTGIAMCFELAVYGTVSGICYRFFPKKPIYIYLSLLISMLAGRVVWGAVRWILALLFGLEFTFQMFLAGAFVTAFPGILCHLLLIPLIVIPVGRFSSSPVATISEGR